MSISNTTTSTSPYTFGFELIERLQAISDDVYNSTVEGKIDLLGAIIAGGYIDGQTIIAKCVAMAGEYARDWVPPLLEYGVQTHEWVAHHDGTYSL